jgi:hypothetical protein
MVDGGDATGEVALQVDPKADDTPAAAASGGPQSNRKSTVRKKSIAGASEVATGSAKAVASDDAGAAGKDAELDAEAGDGNELHEPEGTATAAAMESSNRVRRRQVGGTMPLTTTTWNKGKGVARAAAEATAAAAEPKEDPVEERLADEAAAASAAARQAQLQNRRRQRRREAQVMQGWSEAVCEGMCHINSLSWLSPSPPTTP